MNVATARITRPGLTIDVMALLVSHVDMDGGNKEVPVASRWHEMETVITEAERAGCDVGIAVIGPHGMRFEHRGEDLFHSASCIKIAIMIELFRMVDRGETSLEDVCILRAEDKVPGSGVLQYLHDGIELTFGDIAYLMMAISDNPATNILIDHVGMDNVNTMMRDLGMEQSLLGRRMLGRMALEGEQENVATPNEFALMLRAILNRTAATASSCDKMIVFLEKQQNDRRIGRYVPDGIR